MIKPFFNNVSDRQGVALITSLMIITLLVAVVVEFNRIAIADIDISRNFGDEKKILFVTISGVNAIKELLRLKASYTKSDTLLEEWAKSRAYFDSASGMLDEGKVEGEILDENGKINVNSLIDDRGEFDKDHRAIWERLLSQPRFGLTEEEKNTIIYGIKDWIDKDSEITGIYGAEDSFYKRRGYPCKNSPLNYLEEMLLVNGINEGIFYGNRYRSGIRAYLTVYGDRTININTAPVPVLMALSDNMTEDIALEVDYFRRDDANKTYLNKKDWYKNVWPFEKLIPENLLTISSNFFTVKIKGTLRDSRKEIRAVISRSEVSSKVVFWQEM